MFDSIYRLAIASGFSKHDAKYLFEAYKQAKKSSFKEFNLGCVIVCGNKIVGAGFNNEKSNPQQKYYDHRHRNFRPGKFSGRQHSLHAEMAALRSIPYNVARELNWGKTKAYIFRISEGKVYGQGLSAPCAACAHALADAGVREVIFSTDYGFASSKLSVENGLE